MPPKPLSAIDEKKRQLKLIVEYGEKYSHHPLNEALHRLKTLSELDHLLSFVANNAITSTSFKTAYALLKQEFDKYGDTLSSMRLNDDRYNRQKIHFTKIEDDICNRMIKLLTTLPDQINLKPETRVLSKRYPVNNNIIDKIQCIQSALYFDAKNNNTPLYMPDALLPHIIQYNWEEIFKDEKARKFVLANARSHLNHRISGLPDMDVVKKLKSHIPVEDFFEMYQSAQFVARLGKSIAALDKERERINTEDKPLDPKLARKRTEAITKTLLDIRTIYTEAGLQPGINRIKSINKDERREIIQRINKIINHDLTHNKTLGSWGSRFGHRIMNLLKRISPTNKSKASAHGFFKPQVKPHVKPQHKGKNIININEADTERRTLHHGKSRS